MKTAVLSAALLLSACVYTETPYGRTAVLDLPVHAQTTVNKTVTINAPARDDRYLSRQRTRSQQSGLSRLSPPGYRYR